MGKCCKCSKKLSPNNTQCKYCSEKYCFSCLMPEIHQCDGDYKNKIKKDFTEKEMKKRNKNPKQQSSCVDKTGSAY